MKIDRLGTGIISHWLQQPCSSVSEKSLRMMVSPMDLRPNNFPSKTSTLDHTMWEFEDVMCCSQFLLRIRRKKRANKSQSNAQINHRIIWLNKKIHFVHYIHWWGWNRFQNQCHKHLGSQMKNGGEHQKINKSLKWRIYISIQHFLKTCPLFSLGCMVILITPRLSLPPPPPPHTHTLSLSLSLSLWSWPTSHRNRYLRYY